MILLHLASRAAESALAVQFEVCPKFIFHCSRIHLQYLVKPEADTQRVRKRRNRWGPADENKAAGLMGLPTAILSTMTQEQKEAYVLHLRIEEISQKLRIDDVVPSDNRYASLEPTTSQHSETNSL